MGVDIACALIGAVVGGLSTGLLIVRRGPRLVARLSQAERLEFARRVSQQARTMSRQ